MSSALSRKTGNCTHVCLKHFPYAKLIYALVRTECFTCMFVNNRETSPDEYQSITFISTLPHRYIFVYNWSTICHVKRFKTLFKTVDIAVGS